MSVEMEFAVWVTIAQVCIVILAIAISALEIWQGKKRNGGHFAESLLITLWMGHTVIYYAFVFLQHWGVINIQDSVLFFTSWSATLRLHGYTSLFVLILLSVNKKKMIKKKVEGIFYGSDPTRDD